MCNTQRACRCFEDAKTLDVCVLAAWLPMTIFGIATVLCATLRMVAIALHLGWLRARRLQRYDIVIVDQVRLSPLRTMYLCPLQCPLLFRHVRLPVNSAAEPVAVAMLKRTVYVSVQQCMSPSIQLRAWHVAFAP
jgi:hypothetical protein